MIIIGRDLEIAVPRPPDLVAVLGAFINLKAAPKYFGTVFTHVQGWLTPEELTFIPPFKHSKVIWRAMSVSTQTVSAAGAGCSRLGCINASGPNGLWRIRWCSGTWTHCWRGGVTVCRLQMKVHL